MFTKHQSFIVYHFLFQEILPHQIKCPDHDHLTGQYRGPAHDFCNLNYRIKPEQIQIPCIIHNLKNYDAHLLISAVKKRHGKVTVIANNSEKYITFTLGGVVFKDSCAYMQSSLDSLVDNLTEDQLESTRTYLERKLPTFSDIGDSDSDFDESEYEEDEYDDPISSDLGNGPTWSSPSSLNDVESDDEEIINNTGYPLLPDDWSPLLETDGMDDDIKYLDEMVDFDYRRQNRSNRPNLNDEEKKLVDADLKLIKKKGIYPYEYMDSFERFKETQLPPIEAFSSRLTGKDISKKEYLLAKKVWEQFDCQTLLDYHNLYLLQDVLLLDDVIRAFRAVCLNTYGLDPLHYYTAPGLTWDAGLKYTGITLDLLTDSEKYLFVEEGIRGGISMITHRHARANHPDLADVGYYDASKPKCDLLYLDENNLYGWVSFMFFFSKNFSLNFFHTKKIYYSFFIKKIFLKFSQFFFRDFFI